MEMIKTFPADTIQNSHLAQSLAICFNSEFVGKPR